MFVFLAIRSHEGSKKDPIVMCQVVKTHFHTSKKLKEIFVKLLKLRNSNKRNLKPLNLLVNGESYLREKYYKGGIKEDQNDV